MSYTTTHHPTEEALCDCALHACDEELLKHIEQCTQCSDFVEEIRSISKNIVSIKDEPIPQRLDAVIMAIARCKKKNRVVNVIQNWYKNPFIIGIFTIGLILLLYAVYMLAV